VNLKLEIFRKFPIHWLIYWLLIPNVAIILMWPIGGPPMHAVLVLYGVFALLISQLPWRVARTVGVAALMVWIFTFYLSAMFSIPSLNFKLLFQFLMDVRPLRAPEYLLGAFVLASAFVLSLSRAPLVPRFNHALQFMLAALTVFAFSNLDSSVTARTSDSYRLLPEAGAPFDSAVKQVDLAPVPGRRRHVVLVIVEALGLPVAPEEKRLFAQFWLRPEWRKRYQVTQGSTPFFGSTTSGELRELCGRWSDYAHYDFDHADCLPSLFRAAGYSTVALHGFGGHLFNRMEWYPKIAFDKAEFADDLERLGARNCDGVFPGACDGDVPAIIGKMLAEAKRPQFIYWLTLNSHLPVIVDERTEGAQCSLGSAGWNDEFPRVCRVLQKHKVVADALDRLIMSPELPPTDFLIVGDHKPPFFDRESREHFDMGHVPWIYIRARY